MLAPLMSGRFNHREWCPDAVPRLIRLRDHRAVVQTGRLDRPIFLLHIAGRKKNALSTALKQ